MSAYLMDPDKLAAIARAYATLVQPDLNPEVVFDDLLDTNLASLSARYPESSRISDWFDGGEELFTWAKLAEPSEAITAEALDDMVREYNYQSCEHDGWAESKAAEAMCRLRDALKPLVKAEQEAKAKIVHERRAAFNRLPSLSPKETAQHIRKLLKANFPATKFQVVTERGSMVSSVRIGWTDGPTVGRIESLTNCFEAGKFDGMTDSYEYDNDHALKIDGVIYRPGCKYVSTSRTISADLANRCIARLVEYWGGIDNPPVAIPNGYSDGGYTFPKDFDGHRAPRHDLPDHHYSWHSMIHRAAENRTEFTRE